MITKQQLQVKELLKAFQRAMYPLYKLMHHFVIKTRKF